MMHLFGKQGFLILATLFGIALVPKDAQATAKRCDTCVGDHEFRDEARVLGTGTHLIYNIETGVVQQWKVPQTDEDIDPRRVAARAAAEPSKETPPSGAVAEVQAAHQVFLAAGSFPAEVTVDAGTLGPGLSTGVNAFDFMLDANLRAMTLDKAATPGWINSNVNPTLRGSLAGLRAVIHTYLGLRDQALITLKVRYSDGSSVQITLDTVTGEVKFREGSARTPGGQLIPKSGNIQGTWLNTFDSGMREIANYFQAQGATMHYTGAGGAAGVITTITCANNVCIVITQFQ